MEEKKKDDSFLDTEAAKPEAAKPEAAKPEAAKPEAEKVYVFVGRCKHNSEVFEKGDVAKGDEKLIAYWLSHGVIKLKGE